MILAAATLGEGPPVALLHGLFGQGRNFAGVQRALAVGRRVIALDLRNHGGSPHGQGMSYPAMAGDVLETLGGMGALPCALVGHSMGGKVAMAAALLAPERVPRVLVADIAPAPSRSDFVSILDGLRGLDLAPGLTRRAASAALAGAVPDGRVRDFLLQNFRAGAVPSWDFGLEGIAAGMGDILGWPEFTAPYAGPALFLRGARSDYVLPEHRPLIRALFPAARFATLKGAGHWLHADNPEGFTRVLQDFLA